MLTIYNETKGQRCKWRQRAYCKCAGAQNFQCKDISGGSDHCEGPCNRTTRRARLQLPY